MKPTLMNANGKIKFCFGDSYGNLKIKNISYDSFQSFLGALDKKLGNRDRSGSRATATSKMERFVIIVNG